MEREIAIMMRLNHPRILSPIDVVANDQKKNLYMVLPLAQHHLKRAFPLSDDMKKRYAYQIILAVAYCHSRDVLHLDIKPQNFLVFDDGLKLADFGLALSSNCVTNYNIIEEVQTRWYRSPELLLGGNYKMSDEWAVGCTLYELYTEIPLFLGDSLIDQLFRIFRTFGTPTSESWPGVQELPEWKTTFPTWAGNNGDKLFQKFPPEMEGIIRSLLQMDPSKRSTIFDALKNHYFDDIREDESMISQYSCLETLDMRDAYLIYGKMAIVNPERLGLLDQLKTVCYNYDVSMRAYFLAVHLFDDTNLILRLSDERLPLFARACLWIASIFTEKSAITANDILDSLDDRFTLNELTEMQLLVLKTLSYDLCRATCYDFLIELRQSYSLNVTTVASDILRLLVLTDLPFKYLASDLAIASIYVGCICYGDKFLHASRYTSNVETIIEYLSEIRDPVLIATFNGNETSLPLKTIQQKIRELLM